MTDTTVLAPKGAEAPTGSDPAGKPEKGKSLTSDAMRQLRKNPLFWASLALILVFVTMALFPQLFTSVDPNAGSLDRRLGEPGRGAVFGYDLQGRDIFARSVHGARASILVGVLTTLATMLIGSFLGIVAGYYGGIVDTLISRIADIFFAIPLLLGGIIFLSAFPNTDASYLAIVLKVVLVLAVLGWPGIARLMRSSVLQVKPNDYVQAARALGASPFRIIGSHILPNAMSPVIVVATINLGAYIVTEAALSFLGIGLQYPAVSWGVMINEALTSMRTFPHVLIFPSMFLSLTVLAFIMLGDAVRDAFDPKQR